MTLISMAYLGFGQKNKHELSMVPYLELRNLRPFSAILPIFCQNRAVFGQKTKHGLSIILT